MYILLRRRALRNRSLKQFSREFAHMDAVGFLLQKTSLTLAIVVGLTLWRLTRERKIRRLDRGLYDYPRIHKKLGTLAPNPDDVASALAAKTGSRIQIPGQRAAKLLGLSQQVPAQLVYLTDGPPQKISIGSQKIVLRPARPSKFPSAGTPAGLALQAILAMGPNADKDFIVRQLKSALRPVDRQQLGKLIKHAPAWSHKIIQMIERS